VTALSPTRALDRYCELIGAPWWCDAPPVTALAVLSGPVLRSYLLAALSPDALVSMVHRDYEAVLDRRVPQCEMQAEVLSLESRTVGSRSKTTVRCRVATSSYPVGVQELRLLHRGTPLGRQSRDRQSLIERHAKGPTVTAIETTVPRTLARDYSEVSADDNPLHLDDAAAIAAGFPRAIVHGMATLGHALATVPGASGLAITAVGATFAAPVFGGDRLIVEWGDSVGGVRRLRVLGPNGPVITRGVVRTEDRT
jgi:acyl dehydratase